VRICCFSFCKEDVWRGLKSWKFLSLWCFFLGTMLSGEEDKRLRSLCKAANSRVLQMFFWASVMWAVVLVEWPGATTTEKALVSLVVVCNGFFFFYQSWKAQNIIPTNIFAFLKKKLC
jgi:hypothetical protein